MTRTMSTIHRSLLGALLAVCCASAFAGGQAGSPAPGAGQAAQNAPREHGMRHGRLRLLAGLDLTEAQKDKMFAIMHAAAPQHREQAKALRHAREALRQSSQSDRFDDARANALSRELGQATAAAALGRARVHAQMLAVLTPEQRARLQQRRPMGPRERG